MNFEPSSEEVLEMLVPEYLRHMIHGGILMSQAAENRARMEAMDVAERNAQDMLDDLTLQFNRARQGLLPGIDGDGGRGSLRRSVKVMKSASVGEIIRIIGAVLDIRFPGGQLPEIGDAVTVLGADGRSLTAEAAQQLGDDTVRCVALGATEGLRRGMRAVAAGGPLEVPVGPQTRGEFSMCWANRWTGVRCPRERPSAYSQAASGVSPTRRTTEILETGIKVVDLLCLTRRAEKSAFSGVPVWENGADSGTDSQYRHQARRLFRVYRRGERTREGNDLYYEMKASGVLEKTCMVFGQMNEPPGARMRAAFTGLTMAEYFRDTEQSDVLLFIDNIFRFIQAGAEVSALLGRMPSAVGYQPTPSDGDGGSAGAHHFHKGGIHHLGAGGLCAGGRSDRSAPATTFAHLDAHCAGTIHCGTGHLPGSGPAECVVQDADRADCGEGAF